jgi:glycine/D-amino acid oxidase-like deaminating enzyme
VTGAPEKADAVIIGGGFYGACLALYLRSIARHVVVLEAEKSLLTRASYVNQARVHSGFHYPRSFVTARRSLALYHRFVEDFRDAVVDDFRMLYAIARDGSKVTPERFERMFAGMGAPIRPARAGDVALFSASTVAQVFECTEHAFNPDRLRLLLEARMKAAGIRVLTGARAEAIDARGPDQPVTVAIAGQGTISAPIVVNATYGQFPERPAGGRVRFKYEYAEVALVEPPPILSGLGVTVMDGPFFSVMPFPARNAYSLTHVRYTPHFAWTSGEEAPPLHYPPKSRWLHMLRDAARYMPGLVDTRWRESLYEVKTVLLRNEGDDGRPILLDRDPGHPGLVTVLGSKLDNIYDLFDALREGGGTFAKAHPGYLGALAQGQRAAT